ncbi:Uncharacterized protein JA1_001438 [Spathaspora sp. JA1]|nr:Uncharacterized protein JA1_001438 [Spathaspora sp. JA1]
MSQSKWSITLWNNNSTANQDTAEPPIEPPKSSSPIATDNTLHGKRKFSSSFSPSPPTVPPTMATPPIKQSHSKSPPPPKLRHKSSTTSLASLTSGNWLGWKNQQHQQPQQQPSSNVQEVLNQENAIDDTTEEVLDDTIMKRSKSWAFWNNSTDTTIEPFSNTVLKSNHSTLVKNKDLTITPDDAVLYKPHDKTTEFNQINTHKNENLKENLIVPDWNKCLPNSNNSGSWYNSTSTTSDWKGMLQSIYSKFGLGPNKHNDKEQQAYKLYGKSLGKLAHEKRSCLPNYNKYYQFDQSTQIQDDQTDPNSITINNDPNGNLLINTTNTAPPEIITSKSGNLQKIKNILIIGVHGFFPTKMIRPIIGAPKGTSLKFADESEKAIIRYCIENNLINESESESNISIQKIALEKDGKIFQRVDFFTEILSKWKEELNNADFIFFASHSQGCVVSVILLARLIMEGILTNAIHKRIGILGMAGINNGPFYGTDQSLFMKAYSTIEHESLLELFEFTKFTTQQSVVYTKSIQLIINYNVKICFIGSINDQLVPLYSALSSHIFHPNIYRACYIDQSSNTPKFISKLVGICCELLNRGYFDCNVLKELSSSLSGNLTGGGHSKIYNDGKVYDLGIKFILDTDDIIIPPVAQIGDLTNLPQVNQVYVKQFNIAKTGTNPYILPWCLRSLLFNIEKNHNNGVEEIKQLDELFDFWKPETKILKELKFRLKGLKSKL